jgi:hypothetical protein
MPSCEVIFDQLAGAKWISTMDAVSGYWQNLMHSEHAEKTAFETTSGLYEYVVMPMGLTNAPACFQRNMEFTLRGLRGKIVLIYIDDITIFTKTNSVKAHLQNLRTVFQRLKDEGVKMKLSKCRIFAQQVDILGHVWTRKGLQPDQKKVEAVKRIQPPSNVSEVRSFLGLTGYYRKFIKHYAKMAAPLFTLVKKNQAFQWSDECQRSFKRLKEKLINHPVLRLPDPNEQFWIHTDASGSCIGAVLSQKDHLGREQPVEYYSRILKGAERHYSTTEKECLAIFSAVKKFRPYLHKHFKVVTDHAALKGSFKATDSTGRIQRWVLWLQGFDYEIQYKPGKQHHNADALTRLPGLKGKQRPVREKKFSIAAVSEEKSVVQEEATLRKKIAEMQRKQPDILAVIEYLESNKLPDDEREAKNVIVLATQCSLEDGLLYRIWWPQRKNQRYDTRKQLVVPSALQQEIMQAYHDDPLGGHLGFEKVYEKMKERYFWPKMRVDVKDWVRRCEVCQSATKPHPTLSAKMKSIPVSTPWARLGLDIKGPLPVTESGNTYIVVFQDYFTKWPEAFAVKDISAETVAKLLVEEVICRYGAPEEILTDQGTQFTSKLFKEVNELLGIHRVFTSSYHPQTDGMVENFNKTLGQMLKSKSLGIKETGICIYPMFCLPIDQVYMHQLRRLQHF